eukprot:10430513-Alexandrium_andersonii.AAC.1
MEVLHVGLGGRDRFEPHRALVGLVRNEHADLGPESSAPLSRTLLTLNSFEKLNSLFARIDSTHGSKHPVAAVAIAS